MAASHSRPSVYETITTPNLKNAAELSLFQIKTGISGGETVPFKYISIKYALFSSYGEILERLKVLQITLRGRKHLEK